MIRKRLGVRLSAIELLEPRHMFAGDPLAEWRFDSNSGTVLVDSIGTSNGTITGSSVYNATATAQVGVMPVWTASNATQWGTGTQNGALRMFSDTDGALVDAVVAPQALSVSLWFKADTTNPTRYTSTGASGGSTSGTSVAMPLFESGDSASGMNIYIYNNRLYVGAWNSAVGGWSSGTFLFSASNAIVAGRWHHVVLTLDPTATLQANGLRGYLDGNQFGVGNGAALANTTGIGIGRTDGTTRFLLGTGGSSVINNDTPASNNHRGFAGYVDEYRVYGETLTAADVTAIRDATAPTAAEESWLIRDSGRAATIGRFRFAGQLASEHFVFKWGTGLPANMQPVTTYIQQNLNRLEMSWDIIVEQSGMLAPPARNGVTYKINAYILDTGLWFVDSANATFSGAFAGPDPTGFSALYVSPWALGQSQNPRSITVAPWGVVANTTTTPHEFTHVLQSESGGFGNSDFSGPFYEAHANFGASLVDDYDTGNGRAEITARNSILGRYGERQHRYSMATDFRYQAHLFLNYLTEQPEYGPQFVTSGLWSDPDAQGAGKDPWQVLRNNFATPAEFAQVYADYVASTVTYKALYDGALLSGSPAIPAHNTTSRLFRTYLEPVGSSAGWYQVPEQDTPEQYGSNIIKLTPVGRVAGQPHTITVNLDGYVNPGQTSAIYATLVAISGSGAAVMERFSPTWQNGEMTFELAANETDVYLTVTAIPSIHRNYIWSNPFYPAGGITQKIERFPYRVAMSGAVPVRSETPVDRAAPNGSAVRHTNPDGSLGGWKTVNVPASVYLGPNVWVTGGAVSGNARIEGYATIVGGTVNGNAIVRGNARIQAGTVTGNAVVEDYAVIAGGTISEFAHVRGDALINGGQIRGNALVLDFATIMNNSTVVAGDTVIKGYGVVDNANMSGNALVMSSGLAAGTGLVTNMGVQYNGEPASQETSLMTTQYNNLFARYLFASQDNNAIWENFNTTYGWMSPTPATWLSASGIGGLSGVLEFASDEQYVELSPELSDLRNETIQLWTRWDGSGDANQKIFEFARDAGNYMHLQPTSTEGGIEFEIAVNGVVRTLRGAAPLTAGEWQHVAVTFTGDTATLYVNGSAVATKTSVTMDPNQVRATSALLGKGLASGGYRGRVDNLLVYSDARTPAEILVDVRAVLGGAYVPAPDAEIDHDPGDYNRDGIVDAADYTTWRDLSGQAVDLGTLADGNRDGTVDAADYGVWRSNFGTVTPLGQSGGGALALADDATPAAAAVGETIVTNDYEVALPPLNLYSATQQSSPGRDEAFAAVGRRLRSSLSGAKELATLARYVADRRAEVSHHHSAPLSDVAAEPLEGENDDRCALDSAVPWGRLARQMIYKNEGKNMTPTLGAIRLPLLFFVGTMGVLAATQEASSANTKKSAANMAVVAQPATSFFSGDTRTSALHDGFDPNSSDDWRHGSYGNWPRTGTQWVEYEWSKPIHTDKIDVYWWSDGQGIYPPKACRLLYWDGKEYVPVAGAEGFGVATNKFNTTTFEAVKTPKLRLEIDSDGTNSTGILEWKVYDAGESPKFPPAVTGDVDRVVMLGGKTYLRGGATTLAGDADSGVNVTWSKASGPGEVTFADAHARETTATFSQVGDYVLMMKAVDGELDGAATLKVRVENPPPAKPLGVVYTKRYKIDSPLWNHRAKALITNWIPFCVEQINTPNLREGGGGIDNFVEAGKKLSGQPAGPHRGYVFSNAWVHQTVEAICIALMVDPQGDGDVARAQEQLKITLEDWIPKILSAQEPDGYLQTAFTLDDSKKHWSPRFCADHEGYTAGYFIESAINHYTLTNGTDRRLYDAAKKLADCWVANIGPVPKQEWYDGHQEMEQALVRFGRFVNDMEGNHAGDKYIELAKFLLDCRRDGSEYDQSHVPVQQQYEAVGHAVRAVYSYSGMADVATETGDLDYRSAVMSLWDNMVNKKYYVTGGLGSGETSEGFGPNYSLRNGAYCESCSSCGVIFFQYKMNLSYHEAKYADLYEETFFNALLGSLDMPGKNFYYTNPLEGGGQRYPWHPCPCCVGNIPRTLLMLPTWTYVKDGDGIFVNMFVGSTIKVEDVVGMDVEMVQETNYPWEGHVAITVNPAEEKEFSVRIRSPERSVSGLYTNTPEADGITSISVNGEPVPIKIENGYAVIRRLWKVGDKIEVELPLVPQRVKCDDVVEANRGRVALRYGPLVYNIESVDGNKMGGVLKPDAKLTTEWRPDLLGGVTVIKSQFADGTPLVAVPNFARNNRTPQGEGNRTGSGRRQGRPGGQSLVWIRDE